ncbi:MAG: SDR family oxidoreductase [Nitrospirae bacterium]|nr:SDR family oxidoreductase [Candidatus Troglogloeales bacterium]
MKILITENMGYIGSSVVRRLRDSYPKARLIGVDTGFFAHCLTNAKRLPETRLDAQYFMDVRDIPASLLAGVTGVVSLAAISNDVMGQIDEKLTQGVNCLASIRLAKLAKAAGAKNFVFASSCSVYGFAEDDSKTEQSEVNPLTAYARSKVMTEKGLKPLADRTFKVTCLRFATACGMSERLRLDLVLNDFVAGALLTKKVTVMSDGSPWRPLIHIQDMARAIDWAVFRPAKNGGPFLVCNAGSNAWNYQVKELAQAVVHEIAGAVVSINTSAPPDKRSYRVSFDYFNALAPKENQPKINLTDAVLELKQGLEEMAFNTPDYRNSHFMRIRVLMELRNLGLINSDLRWKKGNC